MLRAIPHGMIRPFLQFYGAAMAMGAVGAAVVLFATPTWADLSRACMAAVLPVAFCTLLMAYQCANFWLSEGVARWKVNLSLAALAVAPSLLLFLSPIYGLAAFVLGVPVLFLSLISPNGKDHDADA
jgi:hypothetical protein